MSSSRKVLTKSELGKNLVEYVLDLNILVVVLGFLTGFIIFMRFWTRTPKYKDDKIKELQALSNMYKGKFFKIKNTELIDEPTAKAVQSIEQVSDAVPTLLNAAAPNLPGLLGTLAKNPQIQGYLKKLAEEHPEEAKQFLGKYIPKITQIVQAQGSGSSSRL